MWKVISKHYKFWGYLIAVIISFIVGALSRNGLVILDCFIFFAVLRIASLWYEINNKDLNIFSSIFIDEDEDDEDYDAFKETIADAFTGGNVTSKEQIAEILSRGEVGVTFKNPLLAGWIAEKKRLQLEVTLLLWVIGISMLLILIAVVPFLRNFLDWVGGYE